LQTTSFANGDERMKLLFGEERVIVRGPTKEENYWGSYQFPNAYRLKDRLVVSVHVGEDSVRHYGDGRLWFQSLNGGESWEKTDASVMADCGLELPNGDRIHFPRVSAKSLDGYTIPAPEFLTPGTDFSQKAEESTLPLQDGITSWFSGTAIRAYLAERLPDSLSKKQWYMIRKTKGGEVREEYCDLDWPCLTRVVHSDPDMTHCFMKGLFPTGTPQIGPDGAIWITAYSGEGHINPKNGQYSPYYSAELFRSADNGRSFQQIAHMEYPADGDRYPYLSGGFSDNEIAFFDDGTLCWFMRTAWYCSTGMEWSPMYISRSADMGKTWTEPEKFAFTGIFPSICRLDCGATLLCYARPGMFITACPNADSTQWTEPITLMPPGDRSDLANIQHTPTRFHDWDGACNNPVLIPCGENSALIIYCDFYYSDGAGEKRKTMLCRKITVDMD